MTGTAFLAALKSNVSPRTVTMVGNVGGIAIKLSDGKTVKVPRAVIKNAANWNALPANVKALV